MNETACGYKCSHESCNETENLTDCYYPDDGSPEEELFAGHYCYDHARELGSAMDAGLFGVEWKALIFLSPMAMFLGIVKTALSTSEKAVESLMKMKTLITTGASLNWEWTCHR